MLLTKTHKQNKKIHHIPHVYVGLLRNPFHSISIFMLYNNPAQQHPITSKFGQTCRMGAHLLNVQPHKQKGPAGDATLVINSDGEQLISSSSGGLCLSAADYRKAELPGGVGWWKWRFVCGAAASARSETPEPLTVSFATEKKSKKRVLSFQS